MATKKKTAAKTAKTTKKAASAPRKCATKTCKTEKHEIDIHNFITFGLAIILFLLCGCFGAIYYASSATENAVASSVKTNP